METWGDSENGEQLSQSDSSGEQLSQSDSSESVINSARDNVNSTINPDVGLETTNDTITDGGEKNSRLKRGRKRKTDSLTMEAVKEYVGKPMDEAAKSLGVSRSTLKRFCRNHDISSWPSPKHNQRTVNAPKCWNFGEHNYPPCKLDSLYQVAQLVVSLQRWRTRSAIKYSLQDADRLLMSAEQFVDSVVSDNNRASKKRKRIDLPISLEGIGELCGKTMKKVTNNLGVGTSKLSCIFQWWPYTKSPKLNQAPVVISTAEEASAPTSVIAVSDEPVVTTNITHDHATLVLHQQEQTNLPDELAQFKKTRREQFIENATTSTVKILTIKATYNENMVKFPLTLLDGLVKLKEMVATKFQLEPGSFKLKYEDKDGDEILIACDTDLMGSVGDSKEPVNSVIRLLVLSVAPKSINA